MKCITAIESNGLETEKKFFLDTEIILGPIIKLFHIEISNKIYLYNYRMIEEKI